MVKVIYIAADGTQTEVDGAEGASVMQTAVAHDVDGIVGECGGSMMCATCHCYVDDEWITKTGERLWQREHAGEEQRQRDANRRDAQRDFSRDESDDRQH